MKYFSMARAYNNALAKLQQAQAEIMAEALPDYLRAEREKNTETMNKILDTLPKKIRMAVKGEKS